MSLQKDEIKKVEGFRELGGQQYRIIECEKDVMERVKAGWNTW